MDGKKTLVMTLFIILIVGIIGSGFYFIAKYGVGQSIIGVSNVNFEDGKVRWVFTGTARESEQSIAFGGLPSSYTSPDGEIISPQQKMTLSIFKERSDCVYQATKREFKGVEYYTLGSFKRDTSLYVIDNYGQEGHLNLIDDSLEFGKVGKLVVQTQGGLFSNQDCPSPSNVVVRKIDGTDYYYDKDVFEDGLREFYETSLSDLPAYLLCSLGLKSSCKIPDYIISDEFLNSFNNLPTFDGTEVRGGINYGNIFFTITADQEYFKSVVYSPEKPAIPKIEDVDFLREITQDGSSGIVVKVSNDGESGQMNIKATTDGDSVSPSFYSTNLVDEKTFNFRVKVRDSIGTSEITFIACGVSQVSSTECDTKTIRYDRISDNLKETGCGDGICQSSETKTTCPSDCLIPESSIECSFGQEYRKESTGFLFGLFPGKSAGCYTAGWLIWTIVIIGLIIVIALVVLILRLTARRSY